MHIAYDGTDFCGWQRQNHGPKIGVSQAISEALERIFHEKITVFASGRTDAGVHALAQVTHFDTQRPEKRFANWDLAWALKPHLPSSISVKQAFLAPDDFHATISATHKTYQYYIFNNQRRPAFLCRYAAWIRKPLDLDFLQASSQYILGKHDFKSFQSVGSDVPHTTREIYQAHWDRPKANMLRFTITGSGFLKQMVRNIIGTQLLLEKSRLPAENLQQIMGTLDRRQAGPPAPPEGLFLRRVYYPQELDNRCREL